jgi:hypothetical protein
MPSPERPWRKVLKKSDWASTCQTSPGQRSPFPFVGNALWGT